MDDFDYFTRWKILDAELKLDEVRDCKASRIMAKFEEECVRLGLPLNEIKSVFKATCAKNLGDRQKVLQAAWVTVQKKHPVLHVLRR